MKSPLNATRLIHCILHFTLPTSKSNFPRCRIKLHLDSCTNLVGFDQVILSLYRALHAWLSGCLLEALPLLSLNLSESQHRPFIASYADVRGLCVALCPCSFATWSERSQSSSSSPLAHRKPKRETQPPLLKSHIRAVGRCLENHADPKTLQAYDPCLYHGNYRSLHYHSPCMFQSTSWEAPRQLIPSRSTLRTVPLYLIYSLACYHALFSTSTGLSSSTASLSHVLLKRIEFAVQTLSSVL